MSNYTYLEENDVNKNFQLFEEFLDSMKESMKNLHNVIAEQSELYDLIKNNNENNKFSTFLEDLNKTIKSEQEQEQIFINRLKMLTEVFELSKENEDNKQMIAKVFIGLGAYYNE